jgi:anti-anti-sigma regulatory factor
MKSSRVKQGAPEVDAAMSRRTLGTGVSGGRAPRSPLPRDFALTLERRGNGTAVLVLVGELDLYRAPEIEQALTEAIGTDADSGEPKQTSDGRAADGGQISGGGVRRLAVDLRSVTFIDSTTLAMLLAATRRQHARGGALLVLVGPQTPMAAFELTGFDRLLAIRRVDEHSEENASGHDAH